MHYALSCIFTSMFTFIQHINHFFRSNSRHGTHSPFVYELADQAIYRSSVSVSKELHGLETIPPHYRQVLTRVLCYWNKEKVYDLQRERGDVLLVKAEELSKSIICQHLNDHALLIVDGIYKSKRNRYAWHCARQEDEVTVSIDLFHFGILLTRPGQVKEDFALRYPFWIR